MGRKVPFGGHMVDVEDVDFVTVKEAWNEYQLADGYRIRVRTLVSIVSRIPGKKSSDGLPVYAVKHHTHVEILSGDGTKGIQ